jgi:hypothetical protein
MMHDIAIAKLPASRFQIEVAMSRFSLIGWWLLVIALIATFRYGYEYIYRDGKRSEMTYHMGEVYPRLQGIYSDNATYQKYTELKALQQAYPGAATLPTVTLADYLANQRPTLPLNWVVTREYGHTSWQSLLEQCRGQVFLIEKNMIERIKTEEEFAFCKMVLEGGKVIEEKEAFLVVRW